MITFEETRLLDEVSYGSQFGHEFNTRIVTLRSGVDRRNAEWASPLGRYTLSYRLIEPDDQQYVIDAHMTCMGSLIGFRFKDGTDYQADKEYVGVGTGESVSYQLIKQYKFGSLTYNRKISKPVDGTVVIYVDDTPVSVTVDHTTGKFDMNAPIGAVITWSGEFDVPVRFESDRLDKEPIVYTDGSKGRGHLMSTDVDLVEIRL